MHVAKVAVIVGIVVLCCRANGQEAIDYEPLMSASPLAKGWMTSDRFPAFYTWLENESKRTTDPDRKRELLATAAFIQFCNGKQGVAEKTIQQVFASGPMSDRTLLIAAQIMPTNSSVVQRLDTIQTQSAFYADAKLSKAKSASAREDYAEALERFKDIPDGTCYVHLYRGILLRKVYRFDESLAEINKQLAICEMGPTEQVDAVYGQLAALHLHFGRYAEALAASEKGLKFDPQSLSLRFTMVRSLCFEDKADEALLIAQQMERDNARHLYTHLALGEALFKRGEIQKSITYFESAHSIFPSELQNSYSLALALMMCGQNTKSANIVQQYLQSFDDMLSSEAKKDLIFLQAVNETYSDEFSIEHKRMLKPILQEGVENRRLLGHGITLFACGALQRIGEAVLARHLLNSVDPTLDVNLTMDLLTKNGTKCEIETKPQVRSTALLPEVNDKKLIHKTLTEDNFESLLKASPLAPAWMRRDQFPQFQAWLEAELAKASDPSRRCELIATIAYIHFCKDELDAAQNKIREASVAKNGSERILLITARILRSSAEGQQLQEIKEGSVWHADALVERAAIYLAEKNYDEVLEVLAKVPDDHPYVHLYRSSAMHYSARADDSRVEARKQIANTLLGPTDDPAAVYYLLSNIHIASDEFKELVSVTKQGLELEPKSAALRFCLVKSLSNLNRETEALGIAEELEKDSPGTHYASAAMGECLYRMRQYERAKPYLQKTVELSPRLIDPNEQLVIALMACGENSQAIEVLDGYMQRMDELLSRMPQTKKRLTFLKIMNQVFANRPIDDASIVAQLLQQGAESIQIPQEARIYACGALFRLGKVDIAKRVLATIAPSTDVEVTLQRFQKQGTAESANTK